jgi:hypothetical protein
MSDVRNFGDRLRLDVLRHFTQRAYVVLLAEII